MQKMNRIFMSFILSLTLVITSITVMSDDKVNEKSPLRGPVNIETEYEQRFSAMGVPINYCKAYL